MNLGRLSWAYLWSRPLAAALNVLLLALGLASMGFLALVTDRWERAFERDLAGIDMVVGAKGSPLQLILSGVLHIDVPPGNVPWAAVQELAQHPQVAQVIPVSVGDSLRGYRIVGTRVEYLQHYGAALAQGRAWHTNMEVVLGASVARALGLGVGSQFAGSHGLGQGGAEHGDAHYTVVGVLAPTGAVLDRLVLTDLGSVWQVHEQAHVEDAEDQQALEAEREVSLALVRYRSPLAAVTLPRWVNSATTMQAAAPALELARLFRMLGVGVDVLRAFAGVLLLTAALSVFLSLWNALRERRGDLALLRMLGASPRQVGGLLLAEALWLAALATLLGLAAAQALALGLAHWLALEQSLLLGGMVWPNTLWAVAAVGPGVAVAAAMVPSLGAYRISVLEALR